MQVKKRNITAEVLIATCHILFFSNAVIFFAKREWLPINPSLIILIIDLITCIAILPSIKNYRLLRLTINLCKPYIIIFAVYFIYFLIGYAYTNAGIEEIFLPLLIILTTISIMLQYMAGWLSIKSFKIILVISFLLLFITTIIDIIYPQTFYTVGSRAGGIAENPNTTAFTMVIIFLFVNILFKNSVITYIILISTVITVAFTLSRGGIFLLIFYLLMKLLFWKKNIKFNKTILILTATVIVYFGFVNPEILLGKITNETALDRVYIILNSRNDIFEDSRVSLVKNYYNLAMEKPMLGNSALKSKDTSVFEVGPHNSYLLMFYEIGIGGVILLLWLVIKNFWFYYKQNFFEGYLFWQLISIQFIFTHNLLYSYFFGFSFTYILIMYNENLQLRNVIIKRI